ncbi:MAG: hypothetical protein JWO57_1698 [Pseudonocardiales bacterium]|nr:hypothetical protein [Pseudonocardiales bacterium]
MAAEQVSDELFPLARAAFNSAYDCDDMTESDIADLRAAIASVLPAHEAMVREQVAQELRDYAGERGDKWMPVIWETIRHCANLARGES